MDVKTWDVLGTYSLGARTFGQRHLMLGGLVPDMFLISFDLEKTLGGIRRPFCLYTEAKWCSTVYSCVFHVFSAS